MSTRGHLRRSHRIVDQWLEKLGFYRKCIARDETCLFRIISEQLYNSQTLHLRVRQEVIQYMEDHADVLSPFVDGPYEEYINRLRKHLVICGQMEISIVSLLYRRDVIIFNPSNLAVLNVTDRNLEEQFLLCRTADDHFDGVFKLNYIEESAFCQSIVYKLLYENVFGIKDTDVIVDLMLHSDKENSLIESNNNHNETESEERLLAVRNILQNNGQSVEIELSESLKNIIDDGLAPFSFKVAKALDAGIYRNIEFDSWNELRKEIRYNQWYKGGEDLTEGVRCLVQLNDESRYLCYIQKLSSICKKGNQIGDEPCVVYVEELAQICTVRRDQLHPLPHATAWPIPLKTYRHLYKETCYNKRSIKKTKQTKQVCKNLDISNSSLDNMTKTKNKKMSKKDMFNSLTSLHALDPVEYTVLPMYNSYSNNPNGIELLRESYSNDPALAIGPPQHTSTPQPQIYSSTYDTLAPNDRTAAASAVTTTTPQYMVVGTNTPFVEIYNQTYEPINYNINRSIMVNGSDLPYHDIPTLRFFYNMGLDYFRHVNSTGAWQPYESNPYNSTEAATTSSAGPIWSVCSAPPPPAHAPPPPVLMPVPSNAMPTIETSMHQLTLSETRSDTHKISFNSPCKLDKQNCSKYRPTMAHYRLGSKHFTNKVQMSVVPAIESCPEIDSPNGGGGDSGGIAIPYESSPPSYDYNFNVAAPPHYFSSESSPNYVFGAPPELLQPYHPTTVYTTNWFPAQSYNMGEPVSVAAATATPTPYTYGRNGHKLTTPSKKS